MNLDNVVARANEVTTDLQAARLYNDIEMEMALGKHEEMDYDQGEQALAVLEQRFDGVRKAAREVTNPPALSRSGWAGVAEEDEEWDDEEDWDEGYEVDTTGRVYLRAVASILVIVALALLLRGVSFAPSANGCPSGTTYTPDNQVTVCERPNGSVQCVQWATGFTPFHSHQGATLTYATRVSSASWPWCADATDPPVGEGG